MTTSNDMMNNIDLSDAQTKITKAAKALNEAIQACLAAAEVEEARIIAVYDDALESSFRPYREDAPVVDTEVPSDTDTKIVEGDAWQVEVARDALDFVMSRFSEALPREIHGGMERGTEYHDKALDQLRRAGGKFSVDPTPRNAEYLAGRASWACKQELQHLYRSVLQGLADSVYQAQTGLDYVHESTLSKATNAVATESNAFANFGK